MRLVPLAVGALALAGVAFPYLSPASAGDAPSAPAAVVKLGNATCPVRGLAVDAKFTTTWSGLEVAFCSAECPKQFAANPNAYTAALLRDLATQLADARARLARYEKPPAPAALPPPSSVLPPPATAPTLVDLGNANCPVMPEMAAKPTVFVDYHGMRIHFCCKMCPAKFQADPQSFLNGLRSDPTMARRIEAAEAAWAASQPGK